MIRAPAIAVAFTFPGPLSQAIQYLKPETSTALKRRKGHGVGFSAPEAQDRPSMHNDGFGEVKFWGFATSNDLVGQMQQLLSHI